MLSARGSIYFQCENTELMQFSTGRTVNFLENWNDCPQLSLNPSGLRDSRIQNITDRRLEFHNFSFRGGSGGEREFIGILISVGKIWSIAEGGVTRDVRRFTDLCILSEWAVIRKVRKTLIRRYLSGRRPVRTNTRSISGDCGQALYTSAK